MKMSKLLKLLLIAALPLYMAEDTGTGDEGNTDNDGDAGGNTGDAGNTDNDGDAEGKGDAEGGDNDGSSDNGDGKGDTEDGEGDNEGDNDDDKVDFEKLEVPEGMELDTVALDHFKDVIGDMSQAEAQKLVTAYSGLKQKETADRIEAFSQQKQDWYDAAASDKEFGGDAFEENAKLASQAVERFGTPELRKFMDDTGMGNHPELVRFMVKVGKATAEDNPGGGAGGAGNGDVKDRAEILYGTK